MKPSEIMSVYGSFNKDVVQMSALCGCDGKKLFRSFGIWPPGRSGLGGRGIFTRDSFSTMIGQPCGESRHPFAWIFVEVQSYF